MRGISLLSSRATISYCYPDALTEADHSAILAAGARRYQPPRSVWCL